MKLDPKSTAFVFPGQGSQTVGMGRELATHYPIAKRTFEEADAILNFGISKIMWEGPSGELNDTINTQPALYVHSLAAFRVFLGIYPDFKPAAVAGHSLGELSALTAAGALAFDAGLLLVRKRGELMKKAGEKNPGSMAAVLNLDIPTLEKICVDASSDDEPVQVANDNCPGQIVISGSKAAVERAMAGAKAAGAKRAIPLAVSIAAHSKLMATIQDEWNEAVKATVSQFGKLDILVNNAAGNFVCPTAELSPKGWKTVIDIDFFRDRIGAATPAAYLFAGQRSLGMVSEIHPMSRAAALRALINHMVIGLGVYQGLEFMLERGAVELLGKGGVVASRLRSACFSLRSSWSRLTGLVRKS